MLPAQNYYFPVDCLVFYNFFLQSLILNIFEVQTELFNGHVTGVD